MSAKETVKETKETKENKADKVEVFIPRRFKGDDVRTVSVNGRYLNVPTGKTFTVPREYAEVIFNASLADAEAEKHRADLAKD